MYSSTNDISLAELVQQGHLNKSLAGILHHRGLDSLSKILHYYLQHKCFYRIKPYKSGSNEKLVALCLKFESEFEYNIEIPLQENEISDQEKIISKKDKKKSNKNRKNSNQDKKKSNQNNFISLFNAFSELKIEIFSYQFKYLGSKLTPRTYKVLEQFYKNYPLHDIIEKIIIQDYRIDTIYKIGVNSVIEWEIFKKEIEDLIFIFGNMNHNEVLKMYLNTFIIQNFKRKNRFKDSEFDTVINQDDKIKLFALIKLLHEHNLLFKKLEKYCFDFFFSYKIKENLNYESGGKVFRLTKSRIRQVKISLLKKLSKHVTSIITINSNIFITNYIDTDKNLIVIDDEMVQRLNEQEGVSYNLRTYGFILGLLHHKTHVLVNDHKFKFTKTKLQYLYLVKVSMLESFDFIKFVKELEQGNNQKDKNKLLRTFENYISKYFKKNDKYGFPEIKEICQTIILKSCNIATNNDGGLEMKRYAKRFLYESVYEILEHKGHPMTLQEICTSLKEIYPDRNISKQSIASIINVNKKLFISISYTSTYGLKKWEESKTDIKGGSAVNMVVEFLQNYDTPMFYGDIAQYVMRYRNTTVSSLVTYIKINYKNEFRFFKGGYIGLNSKTYDEKNLNYTTLHLSQCNIFHLKPLIGRSKDEINAHFVSKLGNTETQVDYMLKLRISSNIITFSEDNILISVADQRPHKPYKPRQKDSE